MNTEEIELLQMRYERLKNALIESRVENIRLAQYEEGHAWGDAQLRQLALEGLRQEFMGIFEES